MQPHIVSVKVKQVKITFIPKRDELSIVTNLADVSFKTFFEVQTNATATRKK